VATKTRRKPRREALTIDLGIAGWRVPVHSHIAYLWESERDFAEAVGFLEVGLRGSDHCVAVGDEEETRRVLSLLERRGIDVRVLQDEKRLTILRPGHSAQEFLGAMSEALESVLAVGAQTIRLLGNVGWNRPFWPPDAELFLMEARVNEIAQRFPCVLLCLHEVKALTGLVACHGAFGTHPLMLMKGGVAANPFLLPLDRVERLGGIVTELSKQQGDREALRRETEILQAIFDNIPVMISLFDASGRPVLVNREWERVLGWSIEETQRTDILSEIYPDPGRRREVLEFIQKAECLWKDFRSRTRDGRLIDTSWVRCALSDGTRIGFGLDLSERKRLERGIKTTEALLAEGEKMSHTGSWALNLASGNLFWSAETFRIFGLEPGQGMPSHPLFREILLPADYAAAAQTVPPEDRPALMKSLERAVSNRSHFEADHRVVRPDGSIRNIHSVGQPVFGESGELLEFVGVLLDVTERRLAEEELRALSERLRAVREEESTRIAREVHDEVGQALTALQMDVAWLGKKLGPSGAPESENLAAKLRSMAQSIDQTIAAVQRIATELRPGVLDGLGLEAAIEWYVREFEKRTGIGCRFHSDLGAAPIDSERATAIFRILQEALTNVARHSGATQVEVELTADSKRLLLEVRDNGRGFPEDRVAHSRSLGLLGMQERARSFDGNVAIRAAPGGGTTIAVTILR
jgi:PAS domain S-box-containing protein